MKKIMCLFITILILISTSFSAYSQEIGRQASLSPLYTEEFKKHLNDYGLGVNEDYERWYIYREYYHYYCEDNTTDIPDWVLLFGSYYGVEPSGCYGIFGEYCIQEVDRYFPYELGYYVYVPQENKFYTLEQAWVSEFENLEEAFIESLVPYGLADIIGDCDGDGKLTVMDVTFMQRAIGGLCVFNSYDDLTSYKNSTNTVSLSYVSDIDRDGKRTIMDATAIQLKLARVESTG